MGPRRAAPWSSFCHVSCSIFAVAGTDACRAVFNAGLLVLSPCMAWFVERRAPRGLDREVVLSDQPRCPGIARVSTRPTAHEPGRLQAFFLAAFFLAFFLAAFFAIDELLGY